MTTNIIVNGGFEDSSTSIAPWVVTGNANASGIDINISPYEGTQHFHFASSTLSQTVSCTVGTSYELTFHAVAIGNSRPSLLATFGTLSSTYTIPNGDGLTWSTFSGSGTCQSSPSDLKLENADPTTIRIDAISLTTPASATSGSSSSPPSSTATSTSTSGSSAGGGGGGGGGSSTPVGAIVGGVVGGLAILVLAAFGAWYIRRRSRRLSPSSRTDEGAGAEEKMLASGVGGFPSEEQRASGLWTGTGASTQSSTPVSRTVVPELQGEDGGAEGPDTYERFERKKF